MATGTVPALLPTHIIGRASWRLCQEAKLMLQNWKTKQKFNLSKFLTLYKRKFFPLLWHFFGPLDAPWSFYRDISFMPVSIHMGCLPRTAHPFPYGSQVFSPNKVARIRGKMKKGANTDEKAWRARFPSECLALFLNRCRLPLPGMEGLIVNANIDVSNQGIVHIPSAFHRAATLLINTPYIQWAMAATRMYFKQNWCKMWKVDRYMF